MGRFELHVVTQHRRELLGIHQAVVVPRGQIAVVVAGWLRRWSGRLQRLLRWILALSWPSTGVLRESGFIERVTRRLRIGCRS